MYIGWQWRNFVPYLCQLDFAAILWVKLYKKCLLLWRRLNTLHRSANDHMDIVVDQMIQFYLNNAINLRPLTPRITSWYTVYPQNGERIVTIDYVTSICMDTTVWHKVAKYCELKVGAVTGIPMELTFAFCGYRTFSFELYHVKWNIFTYLLLSRKLCLYYSTHVAIYVIFV